jgi:hypothetical protein
MNGWSKMKQGKLAKLGLKHKKAKISTSILLFIIFSIVVLLLLGAMIALTAYFL